jgi:hypothetical protein
MKFNHRFEGNFASIFRPAGKFLFATFFALNMRYDSLRCLLTFSGIRGIPEDHPLENLKSYLFERHLNFL